MAAIYRQLDHELDVIERLNFPRYFLIVHEITQFCEKRGILCQGRGSAANSAVCYALGITAVDPIKHRLLFERFLTDAPARPTSTSTSRTPAARRPSVRLRHLRSRPRRPGGQRQHLPSPDGRA